MEDPFSPEQEELARAKRRAAELMDALYAPVRLVAQFADGSRLTFDGQSEGEAMDAMTAAQDRHGGIVWYDGVSDLHYTGGRYYKLVPPPRQLPLVIVDVTDAQDPESALHDPLAPEE